MEIDKSQDHSKILQKIQSLYCYNTETEYIMKFRNFLIDKWDGTNFSSVPFFDGLFIENINLYTLIQIISHTRKNTTI